MKRHGPYGWKIISHKKVYSNEYLEIFEDQLSINGVNKIYIRGNRKDYATIVPFISDNEIMIIKSYRHLVDSIQIELPSGYMESGETNKDSALRELKEETGYIAREIEMIGEYTLDYSMFNQRGYVFVAYDLSKKSEQSLGLMEKIEVDILSIDKIKQLLREGKILNAASIVALCKALDYHERR
jgi:ADP-ribose pyrophosphatase